MFILLRARLWVQNRRGDIYLGDQIFSSDPQVSLLLAILTGGNHLIPEKPDRLPLAAHLPLRDLHDGGNHSTAVQACKGRSLCELALGCCLGER
jgi:hypothetical protein